MGSGTRHRNTKAEPGFIKRRSQISGQFSPRLIEMLESPAYRTLSLSAHRVISRIEIELAHHGGNDNGRLPVTKLDFVQYGVSSRLVAPAIREAEALGFIRVTERGRGGNAEHRQPNKFFLTFAHSRESRANPPTHDWRKIKCLEEAMEIARTARDSKDYRAVQFAEWRAKKTKHRTHKVAPIPDPQNDPEGRQTPDPLSGPTGSGHAVVPLSISRVRGPRYPRGKSTQSYSGYSSLPVELRLLALGLSSAKNSASKKIGDAP
jgi:hypothetical protein